ncbi:hypothetical protein [Methylovirgula sp. HY1]|uniref:hypothetical protein n=1 Tax=Methylovirgula sp. HY1 TaxID=2822761 RepID=UPI001C5AAB73|nr:hypothetical protein [Methylovirgula sp. HY1]QXX75581.1 hypothetical protein MHY1_02405 [Methylovirgula sp. HY1]
MALTSFEYVTSNSDGVMLMARDEPMMVEASIPKDAIDAYFDLQDASAYDRQTIVLANLAAFGRIAAGKYERGELNYHDVAGLRVAQIRVSLFDMQAGGLLRRMGAEPPDA